MPEGRGKHYYHSRKISLSKWTVLGCRRKKERIKKFQIFKKKEKENRSKWNKQDKLQWHDSRKQHGTHRGLGPGTATAPTPGSADGRIPRAAPPALPVLAAVPQLNLLQLAAESIQIPEKEDGLIYSVCSAYITSFKTESPATACPSQVFIFL